MSPTILVVDDDAAIRDATRLLLARNGYHVLTASDGRSALDLMASDTMADKVSVLLCDLEMPNMDGRELIECFRKLYPNIPIIVMSGASDSIFLDSIVQEGVGDWVRKPVTRETLLDKVRTATNLYTLRQQHQ